ncbi:MAG: TonB-dependent receptor [Tannerella sp.]|nr:TonB-dependent receptor [Tannerella sp.]
MMTFIMLMFTVLHINATIESGSSLSAGMPDNNPMSENPMQSITVTGAVTDNQGEPLPGVSISIRGTTQGTVTDANGAYSLNVPNSDAVLEFTYVGFNKQDITVGSQRVINVTMIEETSQLDEVVVIGYGTVKKKDLTGSVGSIRRRDIGELAVVNVEQMIQGRIAGVDVVNNGGLPGVGTTIKIRGVGTIYNSDPLYIIDGMSGDINSVSQYDIESIEILKDASSTAIYGARAANGVVLITTKRGVRGTPKVTLNAYYGIAQPAKKLELLNASQYVDLATELNPFFFRDATRFKPVSEGGMGMNEQWARTDRAKIQDEIFQNAAQQEYNLNINGGGDNSIYNVSGTYTNMDGITRNYNYERLNLMTNLEFTIKKIIKIGQSLSLRRTNRRNVTVDYVGALRWAPYMATVDPENSWGFSKLTTPWDMNDTFNPMTDLNLNQDNQKSTSIREQAFIEVALFDMFKWRTQIQYTNDASNGLSWAPYRENGNLIQPASINENYSYSQSAMIENYLTFDKSIGIHTVNAMVGNTYSTKALNNGRSASIAGSGSDSQAWENYEVLLINRTPSYTVSGNNTWHSAYLSYYGRLNYSLMDRYLLTFNYRQDASPNFSPKNRWGRFPSLALAWKMDEEDFTKSIDNLSQAKLRLSWGKSGNDRIESYAYLANLYSGNGFIVSAMGVNQGTFMGMTINGLPATDIRWETTTSYNAGLDVGFHNNALTASLDVYTRKTDGILVNVPIPGSSGIDGAPIQNAAEVSNTGFEFQAGYNRSIGELNLSVSGVISYNKNEVLSLGQGEPIVMDMVRTEKGHSVGEYYGYVVDKVLSTTAEADAYNQKYGLAVVAGDIAFKDIAGPNDADGNPTGPDGKIDDNDRTFIGQSIPPWSYGLNLSANWRQFDFQLGMTGVSGNKLFDYTRIFEFEAMKRIFNQTATVLDRWQKEGDVTDMPRAVEADPSNNLRMSDRYVKDGSYLRLKNITLGYTVPSLSDKYIDKLRLYVSCQNLYTFTKYDGYDPEVGAENSGDARNYNMRRGVVRSGNMTPLPRTFVIGLQATF